MCEKVYSHFISQNITQRLNEVYGNDDYLKEFEPISNAALESMRELTKDDTW
jgi:Mn-dependent DtxR family transcriptional regulator